MRIEVIGRNIEVTDAIRTYAEGKAAKLTKYLANGVQLITMTVSKVDHQHHGMFEAEIVLDVEHHKDFVATASAEDLYAAVDLVSEKGERQLRDFKEKTRNRKH